MEQEKKSNRPIKEIQIGDCKAAVWLTKKDDAEFLQVSLQRTYKDKEGNYKNTGNLRPLDLPKVQEIMRQAYVYCMQTHPKARREAKQ